MASEVLGADGPSAAASVPQERAPIPPPPGYAGRVGQTGENPRHTHQAPAGRIVSVEVTATHDREVLVKLADGRPGTIPRRDFEGEPPPKPGDQVEAALLDRRHPRGLVELSRAWARSLRGWERIEAAKAAGEPVAGTIVKVVKGGVIVDAGLRCFMPVALLDEHPPSDLAALVGTEIEAVVLDADRDRDRVLLSHRDLVRRRRRQHDRDVLGSLEVGTRRSGTVVAVADYGVQVDLDGVRGLIHRSELTWGRLSQPSDLVAVGDEVEIVVLDVNRSKRRVGLSMRRTSLDPLESVEVGRVGQAVITSVVEFGAFARLDGSDDTPGPEGLIHISELTEVPGLRPDQIVAPGDVVTVKVIDLDSSKRRLGLSIRRAIFDG